MKYIKLSLIMLIVIILLVTVYKIIVIPPPPPPPPAQQSNQFVSEINDSLIVLQAIFDTSTYEDFKKRYYATSDRVTLFAAGGDFDSNDFSRNSIIKADFEKSLYALFSKKYIKSTFSLLNLPDWDLLDFRSLRQVKDSLLNSQYLLASSSTADSLRILQSIFDQYDTINSFYQSCISINLSFSSFNMTIPLNDIRQNMQTAESYLANNLGNNYLNNSSLRRLLENLPSMYFNKCIFFLNEKFLYLESNFRIDFSSINDFMSRAYNPLREEIRVLNFYPSNVDLGGTTYNAMAQRLSQLYRSAYAFFNIPR